MSETVDRSKCHPDCGKTRREHALSDHDFMGPGWVASSGVLWCSLACRTAKLPPIVPSATREKAGTIPTCVSCLKPSPTVATRVVRKGRVEWCDACFVESDSYACLHEGLYGATGVPCAQPPGLLPKPRMAADWYEDCLPEVR